MLILAGLLINLSVIQVCFEKKKTFFQRNSRFISLSAKKMTHRITVALNSSTFGKLHYPGKCLQKGSFLTLVGPLVFLAAALLRPAVIFLIMAPVHTDFILYKMVPKQFSTFS